MMTSKRKIAVSRIFNSWNGIAKKIGAVSERNARYSQYILQYMNNNSVVLDVGCNVGQLSVACAKKTARIISVDFDKEMLRCIPKIDGIHRLLCDAQSLPIRQESVDNVLAISVLEHLRNPELALEEFHRVLTRKGFLIVQIPNPEYFVEPHTMFPLLFVLPERIRDKIRLQTFGYYYTNFKLSKKKLLELLTPLFVVREIIPVYHKLKTPPWPPSWIMLMTKKRVLE